MTMFYGNCTVTRPPAAEWRCYRATGVFLIMHMTIRRLSSFAALSFALAALPSAQNNWSSWGQDPGGTKFSTLNQITTENVKTLQRAWTFHTGDTSGFFESTP